MKKQIALVILFAGFSLLFGQSPILFQKEIPFDQVTDIEINLTYENLEIHQIYGEKVLIEMSGNNSTALPVVDLSEGKLTIKSKKERFSKGNTIGVQLYVPRYKSFLSGDFSVSSGSILIEGFEAQTFVRIKSQSGQMTVKNVQAGQIELNSLSGSVFSEGLTAEYLKAESYSGTINLSSITADYFDIETKSADIFASFTQEAYAASSIKSISGNIKVDLPEGEAEVYIKTKTGKVE